MSIPKKRVCELFFIMLLAIFPLALAYLTYQQDEYISGQFSNFAQAMIAFAFFRFPYIKRKQAQSNGVLNFVFFLFGLGMMLVCLSDLGSVQIIPSLYEQYFYTVGTFLGGLSMNMMFGFLANHFDKTEADQDRERKREKKKMARAKKRQSSST